MSISVPSSSAGPGASALNADTSHGKTVVNDAVVAKVAGIAAREVPGVHDLGGGASRAIGAIRTRLNNADHSQGVSVEVGETQVAADVTVIADYPMPLQHIADVVRTAITTALSHTFTVIMRGSGTLMAATLVIGEDAP